MEPTSLGKFKSYDLRKTPFDLPEPLSSWPEMNDGRIMLAYRSTSLQHLWKNAPVGCIRSAWVWPGNWHEAHRHIFYGFGKDCDGRPPAQDLVVNTELWSGQADEEADPVDPGSLLNASEAGAISESWNLFRGIRSEVLMVMRLFALSKVAKYSWADFVPADLYDCLPISKWCFGCTFTITSVLGARAPREESQDGWLLQVNARPQRMINATNRG